MIINCSAITSYSLRQFNDSRATEHRNGKLKEWMCANTGQNAWQRRTRVGQWNCCPM